MTLREKAALPGSPEWLAWVRSRTEIEGAIADMSIVRHLLDEIERLTIERDELQRREDHSDHWLGADA